ncbi:MAG: hypothetical protein C3F08_01085 [Candidatus Methylomirabilota bacterium]|nr:MAG: hypothetical protein C3F08_01085 [candidate division NC10 bacterium]
MWGPLTATERCARKALLELILRTGRDPGLKALASRLEVSEALADELLSALEQKGLLVRDQRSNQIAAAFPLSTRPTQHQIMLKGKGKPRYANCAIDALSVGPLFGAAVIVNATCPHCGRSIRIHVEENQIAAVEPPGAVVWDGLPGPLMKRAPKSDLAEAY